jgi:hypothetical protein
MTTRLTNGNDYYSDGSGLFALDVDEEIWAEYGYDTVLGNAGADTIYFLGDQADYADGGSGNDRIYAGGGNDTLYGNDDDDLIFGNGGNDFIGGGAGQDTVDGGKGDDTIYGNEGHDSIEGGIGNDELIGGQHNDTLKGGADADWLFGEEDNDLLMGGSGNDSLFGGLGDDTLRGGSGIDQLHGGQGYDTFVFMKGSGWNDVVLDYDDRRDMIDLSKTTINKFEQLDITDTTYDGMPAAYVDYGSGGFYLLGVRASQLDADDFVLNPMHFIGSGLTVEPAITPPLSDSISNPSHSVPDVFDPRITSDTASMTNSSFSILRTPTMYYPEEEMGDEVAPPAPAAATPEPIAVQEPEGDELADEAADTTGTDPATADMVEPPAEEGSDATAEPATDEAPAEPAAEEGSEIAATEEPMPIAEESPEPVVEAEPATDSEAQAEPGSDIPAGLFDPSPEGETLLPAYGPIELEAETEATDWNSPLDAIDYVMMPAPTPTADIPTFDFSIDFTDAATASPVHHVFW